MDFLYRIAEQRITAAIENGEFRNLEGEGKPLRFEDEFWIPDDLRVAYKFLKNAGCIPPEIEMRKEIVNLLQSQNALFIERLVLNGIRQVMKAAYVVSDPARGVFRGGPSADNEWPVG